MAEKKVLMYMYRYQDYKCERCCLEKGPCIIQCISIENDGVELFVVQ